LAHDVHDGVLTIEGDDGQRIGIGTGTMSMMLFVKEGSASTTEAAGTGNDAPQCRFEVRSDGKVGVGKK
jgi:hypothetical protein